MSDSFAWASPLTAGPQGHQTMPTFTHLDQISDALAARLQQTRRPSLGWNSVVVVCCEGTPAFHVIVQHGGATVHPGGHPRPVTVVDSTLEALELVVLGTLDITHEIARGAMKVVQGDYFDCIFLSKSLRGTTAPSRS